MYRRVRFSVELRYSIVVLEQCARITDRRNMNLKGQTKAELYTTSRLVHLF